MKQGVVKAIVAHFLCNTSMRVMTSQFGDLSYGKQYRPVTSRAIDYRILTAFAIDECSCSVRQKRYGCQAHRWLLGATETCNLQSMLRLRRSEGLWSEWGQRPTIHLGPHSSHTPGTHPTVVASGDVILHGYEQKAVHRCMDKCRHSKMRPFSP